MRSMLYIYPTNAHATLGYHCIEWQIASGNATATPNAFSKFKAFMSQQTSTGADKALWKQLTSRAELQIAIA